MRAILEWLGQQARWALPAGVFIGIAVPPLASALRPTLTAAVIGTLTAALVRLDWTRLARTLAAPRLPALMVAALLLASPVLAWLPWQFGLASDPVGRILVLQLAAPPIGSAAAFALFVGIDGSLAMIVTVAATLLLPLTLTAVVAVLLAGSGVAVDIATFFLRVLVIVVAPFALAAVLRAGFGVARLARNDRLLAGINVVLLVVFAVAVMDGVTARLLSDPATILGLLALACGVALLGHGIGFVLFRATGRETALAAALLSGNRNLGLMLAITGGTAGTLFGLYVGVAQIPMYFAPLLLSPFAPNRPRPGPGRP